jgi:hypothetical protein
MQANNNLGFVVWGVKNGFQNNLFSHNLSESIRTSLVDIQELCMPQYGVFYSIERIGFDTLVSLYDPTVMDYSGSRKAYIVFSIIFPAGFSPASNIFDLLESFRNYYKVESNGLASNEIFLRKLNEFNVKSSSLANANFGTTIGYKNYENIAELTEIFSDIDILDYRKVYFFDRPNSYVTSNPNFTAVTSLQRKYSVDLINYNPHDFQITINGIAVTNENLHIQGPYAKLINLKRYDKIEIKRGGSQPVASFNANEKNRVDLPKTQPATPKEFIIRNLNPNKHRVVVNDMEQPTSHMTGSELRVAISTPHVRVKIIDKVSNHTIQEHDTTLHNTYVMMIISYGVGTGGNGGTGGAGGNGGNSGNAGNDKPRKKSKAGLIITLSSIVILAIVAIVLWKSGIFDEEVNPPVAGTTQNASPNAGTKNVVPEPAVINEYPGYTLKSKYPAFKTKEGFKESNDDIYRLKDGKLEVRYYQSESKNNGAWTEMKNPLLASVLKSYFDKNDGGSSPEDTEKTTNGGSNTGDTKTGGTGTGGSNSGGSNSGGSNSGGANVGKKCDALLKFKNTATTDISEAKKNGNKGTVKAQKIIDIQLFSEEDCKNCPGGLTLQSVINHINGL